jgi:hypothetical protein
MNKRLFVAAALAVTVSSPGAAATVSGFSGPFDPATWTTTIIGNVAPPGADANEGSVSAGSSAVTLTGGDDPAAIGCLSGFQGCEVRFTHSVTGFVSFSFHWDYLSLDAAAAQLDQFGLLLDGLKVDLSDPGAGLHSQAGDFSFTAVNSFGWFMNCGDCAGGSASATISAFSAAVPEPTSTSLILVAMLSGLAALRRTPKH